MRLIGPATKMPENKQKVVWWDEGICLFLLSLVIVWCNVKKTNNFLSCPSISSHSQSISRLGERRWNIKEQHKQKIIHGKKNRNNTCCKVEKEKNLIRLFTGNQEPVRRPRFPSTHVVIVLLCEGKLHFCHFFYTLLYTNQHRRIDRWSCWNLFKSSNKKKSNISHNFASIFGFHRE